MNGEKIGHSENALIPHVFPCGSALRPGSENVVRVEIHSALLHAAQQDFPVHACGGERSDEYVRLRMPPHSFGWDITPRFPSAGMWRGVTLESVPKTELTQTYYVTRSVNERRAEVLFKYRFRTEETNFRGHARAHLSGWPDGRGRSRALCEAEKAASPFRTRACGGLAAMARPICTRCAWSS